MSGSRWLVLALALACAVLGVGWGVSAELKQEREGLLREMYGEYGGSEVARVIGEPAVGVDRDLFDAALRTVGGGDRPSTWTARATEYLNRPDVVSRARRVVELDHHIRRAEQDLAELAPR